VAVSVTGKVLLGTNVFIDHLRAELHLDWVFGGVSNTIRFLSAVVLMDLHLGADATRRKRCVEHKQAAFPTGRLIALLSPPFDHAGRLFRTLYGDGSELADRLGPVNDLLIALTARQMGATLVTSNLQEFRRINAHESGLKVIAPVDQVS
jgi:predicted nucleic acid-binding protein